MALAICALSTHVSAPQSATAATAALQGKAGTSGVAPSLAEICLARAHFFRVFFKLQRIAISPLPGAEMGRPKCLDVATLPSTPPWAVRAWPMACLQASKAPPLLFAPAAFLHF